MFSLFIVYHKSAEIVKLFPTPAQKYLTRFSTIFVQIVQQHIDYFPFRRKNADHFEKSSALPCQLIFIKCRFSYPRKAAHTACAHALPPVNAAAAAQVSLRRVRS